MKLVRHGAQIVAIIEQGWEKAYLHSQRGKQAWVPVFLVSEARPFAGIHSEDRQVRRHTCLKLRGCLMSLRLDLDNAVCCLFLADGTIVTSTMSFMEVWILENRLWWLRSRRQMTEHLIILLEQGIHEGNQAPNHMAKGLSFAFVGLCLLIIGTKPGNQALVQAGPFRLGLDRVPCYQIHDLLHLTRATFREACSVKGDSRLCPLRCPSAVRFEVTSIFKISNMPDRRKNGCGIERADWGDREQNVSLPTVLDDLGNLHIPPFHVFLNETQFFD